MRRVLPLVIVLVMAACGGDSGDEGADEPTTPTQAQTTQAPANDDGADDTTTTAPAASGSEGSGPSTATVTIGDQTYEFSTEGALVAQCLTDLFGIFSVQLPAAGGADGSVRIVALLEGTDPDVVGEVNAIEVDTGDDDWIADEADTVILGSDLLEPGDSQVDSVEVDGSTVRGTATFVRGNSLFTGEPEIVTGTFEATCGEERTA